MTPTQRENAIVECIQVLRPIVKGQSPQEQALEELIGFLPTTAEPAPVQEPSAWLPMDAAPKDGTHVFLLVEFEDHAMEDGPAPQLTIGSNTSENDGGPDEWQFAGWNWEHDCYTQGVGTPVSWLPKTALLALVQQPAPPADVPMLTDDEILNAYCANPSERQYVTVFCAGAKWAEKTLRQKAGLK